MLNFRTMGEIINELTSKTLGKESYTILSIGADSEGNFVFRLKDHSNNDVVIKVAQFTK